MYRIRELQNPECGKRPTHTIKHFNEKYIGFIQAAREKIIERIVHTILLPQQKNFRFMKRLIRLIRASMINHESEYWNERMGRTIISALIFQFPRGGRELSEIFRWYTPVASICWFCSRSTILPLGSYTSYVMGRLVEVRFGYRPNSRVWTVWAGL